jgi:hypothetical protein
LYTKKNSNETPYVVTREWELSLANPSAFLQWKQAFAVHMNLWSLLPDLHETVSSECAALILQSSPYLLCSADIPSPLGVAEITNKKIVTKSLCRTLLEILFRFPSNLPVKSKQFCHVLEFLVGILNSAPISNTDSIAFVMNIFNWSLESISGFQQQFKTIRQKTVYANIVVFLESFFKPLCLILGRLSGHTSLFGEVDQNVKDIENLFLKKKEIATTKKLPEIIKSNDCSAGFSDWSGNGGWNDAGTEEWGDAGTESRWLDEDVSLNRPTRNRGRGRGSRGRGRR